MCISTLRGAESEHNNMMNWRPGYPDESFTIIIFVETDSYDDRCTEMVFRTALCDGVTTFGCIELNMYDQSHR
jgi:hypothetical protein